MNPSFIINRRPTQTDADKCSRRLAGRTVSPGLKGREGYLNFDFYRIGYGCHYTQKVIVTDPNHGLLGRQVFVRQSLPNKMKVVCVSLRGSAVKKVHFRLFPDRCR
ncbi:hypothetical protein KFV02_09990 [Desulfohalobiaceae bacterium Ax17]|uniref:hypothetical protein n=1 Tax=Desulfovulcanus ferrireducens TaxID=2831190 RepID=UPI00207BC3A8|nr:hypothetical protein [Desulfovulcanus ferrireducens]MBT8764263.1 hypothetical protein [Desulfovulcanus ferrireducens]